MSLLQMRGSDCSFSRAGKCTPTDKVSLPLNTRLKVFICLSHTSKLKTQTWRRKTLERQHKKTMFKLKYQFKHMMFVKNKRSESPHNQVADVYPSTGLKTRSAFQSLLTKTFATFPYAISLFTSHGMGVQLLEKPEW